MPQTHESRLLGGAQIAGRVVDSAGGTMTGVQVRVLDNNSAEVNRTTSDDRGEYGISGLPDGTYRLEFESQGFSKLVVNNAEVRNGLGGEQDATLHPGEMSQTVTVTAAAPTVEITNSSLAGNAKNLGSGRGLGSARGSGTGGGAFGGIPGQGLVDAPLNGRNWSNLTALQPGVAFNSLLQTSTPSAAEGQDLGDLFEYKLKDRVTLRKNQSAMVPILQCDIGAEKVSVWTAALNSSRPLRAVWLTNTSSDTLDGGNFSVLEDEIFAGQGLLDAIKPGERRLLSYATDLGMLVRAASLGAPQHNTRVSIAHGVMIRTSELREKKTYTVRNEDTSARTLIIEHPARIGWTLSPDSPKHEETSMGSYRFRVNVAPKQAATVEINESSPIETRFELNNITDDQIALMVREGSVSQAIEQALRKIIDQKFQVAAINAEAEKRDAEITRIYDDQQRLRENLKVLKGSVEEKALTLRYTQQLSAQETRLEKLRMEKEDIEKKGEVAQEQVDKMIENLSIEATL